MRWAALRPSSSCIFYSLQQERILWHVKCRDFFIISSIKFEPKMRNFFAGLRPAPRWGSRPRTQLECTPPSAVTGRRYPEQGTGHVARAGTCGAAVPLPASRAARRAAGLLESRLTSPSVAHHRVHAPTATPHTRHAAASAAQHGTPQVHTVSAAAENVHSSSQGAGTKKKRLVSCISSDCIQRSVLPRPPNG